MYIMAEIVIKDGTENMDFEAVTDMLGGSYWVPGIRLDEVLKGAVNSALVVGAFIGGTQVGYCRAISDKTRFAYISDVFVRGDCRGMGVAKRMVEHMLNHPSLQDVYQWLLRTTDAHELYRKLGFEVLAAPDKIMEIRRQRPER